MLLSAPTLFSAGGETGRRLSRNVKDQCCPWLMMRGLSPSFHALKYCHVPLLMLMTHCVGGVIVFFYFIIVLGRRIYGLIGNRCFLRLQLGNTFVAY